MATPISSDISFYKPSNLVQASQDTTQSASTTNFKFNECDKLFSSDRTISPKPPNNLHHLSIPSFTFNPPHIARFQSNFLRPHSKIICCFTYAYLILSVLFFLSECISILYWLTSLSSISQSESDNWFDSSVAVYLCEFFDFLRQSFVIVSDVWICRSLLSALKARIFLNITRSLRLYKIGFIIHLLSNLAALLLLGCLSLWKSNSLLYQYYSLNYYYGVYSPKIAPVFGAIFIFAFSILICVVGYDQLHQYSRLLESYERLKHPEREEEG